MVDGSGNDQSGYCVEFQRVFPDAQCDDGIWDDRVVAAVRAAVCIHCDSRVLPLTVSLLFTLQIRKCTDKRVL